jgi:hypothetical protein
MKFIRAKKMVIYCWFVFIFLLLNSFISIAQGDNNTTTNTTNNLPQDTALITIKEKKTSTLVFPVLGRAPETSWTFGAASVTVFKTDPKDSLLRTSTVPLGLVYSLKHQIIISNGVNLYFPKEKYIFRLENTYTKFPDKFWGIGYNTPYSNLENYEYSQLFINPQFLKKVYKDYFVGICAEYQNAFYIHHNAGGIFDQENIAGKDGSRSVGLGLELSRDNRNSSFSATKGGLVKLLTVVFNKAFASQYNYSYTELDVRKYISLNKNNVLAFQLGSTLTFGNVPYRNLATLGGPNMMRGYYGGRYRDYNVVAFQVEERMHLFWRIGIVGFAGLGQVSDNLTHWHLDKIKYSIGSGLRFAVLPKEKLNVRLDYGFGYKSQNFYLTVTEAF